MKNKTRRVLALMLSFAVFAITPANYCNVSAAETSANETQVHYSFEELLAMSDEEISAISDDYAESLTYVDENAVFYSDSVPLVNFDLHFEDASAYLERVAFEGLYLKIDVLREMLALPDFISSYGYGMDTNIDGKTYDTISICIRLDYYDDYSPYTIYRTAEVCLRANDGIDVVETHFVDQSESQIPETDVETTTSSNSETTTVTTTSSTTSSDQVHYSFEKLLDMDDGKIHAISEEYTKRLNHVDANAIYYSDSIPLASFDLHFEDASMYLENDPVQGISVNTDALKEMLALPDMYYSISSVKHTQIDGKTYDTISICIRLDCFDDYRPYTVYRTAEVYLRAIDDIDVVETCHVVQSEPQIPETDVETTTGNSETTTVTTTNSDVTSTPDAASYSFAQHLAMSDEEISAISEEYAESLRYVNSCGISIDSTAQFLLHFSENYDYLNDEDAFYEMLALPDELSPHVQKFGRSNISGKDYIRFKLTINLDACEGYSELNVLRTAVVFLRANNKIDLVELELLGESAPVTPETNFETTTSTDVETTTGNSETTTVTTTNSDVTSTPDAASYSFAQLLAMSDEEICAISEEYARRLKYEIENGISSDSIADFTLHFSENYEYLNDEQAFYEMLALPDELSPLVQKYGSWDIDGEDYITFKLTINLDACEGYSDLEVLRAAVIYLRANNKIDIAKLQMRPSSAPVTPDTNIETTTSVETTETSAQVTSTTTESTTTTTTEPENGNETLPQTGYSKFYGWMFGMAVLMSASGAAIVFKTRKED